MAKDPIDYSRLAREKAWWDKHFEDEAAEKSRKSLRGGGGGGGGGPIFESGALLGGILGIVLGIVIFANSGLDPLKDIKKDVSKWWDTNIPRIGYNLTSFLKSPESRALHENFPVTLGTPEFLCRIDGDPGSYAQIQLGGKHHADIYGTYLVPVHVQNPSNESLKITFRGKVGGKETIDLVSPTISSDHPMYEELSSYSLSQTLSPGENDFKILVSIQDSQTIDGITYTNPFTGEEVFVSY